MRRLLGAFRHEPPVWAVTVLADRIGTALRQRMMAWMLDAPDLRVGRGSTIRGARHIFFGLSFHAHGAVWLEAISRYGGVDFSPRIILGDHISASDDLHISCIDRIEIGEHVLFGSRVYVSDHNHGNYRGESNSLPSEPPAQRQLAGGGPVVIGKNVWIGHNVVIIGPVKIGDGAIVGANSVVRTNVAAGTVVAGVPAGPLKAFDSRSRRWETLS